MVFEAWNSKTTNKLMAAREPGTNENTCRHVIPTLVAVFIVTAKKIKLGFTKFQFLKHVKYLPFSYLRFLLNKTVWL